MDTIQSLQTIGLSQKEAQIYVALLQTGRTSAYAVAVKSGLKRSTTYVLLDELVEKGFALRVPRAKQKMYEAKPADEVFAIAKERMELAEKSIAELKSITRKKKGKTQTLYFEGNQGLEQAFNYRIKEQTGKELVGFYATDRDVQVKTLEVVANYLEKMKKYNITARGFAPDNGLLEKYRSTDKEYKRDIRPLAMSDYSSTVSIEVILDFVRVIDAFDDRVPQATIIESPQVADALREIFEIMWKK